MVLTLHTGTNSLRPPTICAERCISAHSSKRRETIAPPQRAHAKGSVPLITLHAMDRPEVLPAGGIPALP